MAQIDSANRRAIPASEPEPPFANYQRSMNTRPLDALASFPLLPMFNTKSLVFERFIGTQLVKLRQASHQFWQPYGNVFITVDLSSVPGRAI